jgi:hypothetical protein
VCGRNGTGQHDDGAGSERAIPVRRERQNFAAGKYMIQRDDMSSSVVLIRGEKNNNNNRSGRVARLGGFLSGPLAVTLTAKIRGSRGRDAIAAAVLCDVERGIGVPKQCFSCLVVGFGGLHNSIERATRQSNADRQRPLGKVHAR